MHLDFKTASEIKIHNSIVLPWKPRISWKSRHFLAFSYMGVSIPEPSILHLHCISIGGIYKPWHIKIYIVQKHVKSQVKSFEVRLCKGFTLFTAFFRPYHFHCHGVFMRN